MPAKINGRLVGLPMIQGSQDAFARSHESRILADMGWHHVDYVSISPKRRSVEMP